MTDRVGIPAGRPKRLPSGAPESIVDQLDREREEADQKYAAALSALDRTVQQLPATLPLQEFDADISRLNQAWSPYGPPSQGGVVRRVLTEIGRLLPWRRRALNGAMVAALNRNAEMTRALADALRHHADGAIRFQSHMVWYAQSIYDLVDSRNRASSGLREVEVLHGALTALTDDWMKRWETLNAREQRYDARSTSLHHAVLELKDIASLAHQSTTSLKRVVERLSADARPTTAAAETGTVQAGAATPAQVDLDAFKYVGFEDRFRGSREDIRGRLSDYIPLFAGASNVLDIGCGRGELLDLLRENGISARGIDVNAEMVEVCKTRGLEAATGDALAYLTSLPDDSLGGIIAIQVVEHLEPAYLARLIEVAYHKLQRGAPLVLETINAACMAAFFDSYIRDLTHVRPLHPDTLRYLVQASGFPAAEIQYRAPVSDDERLPRVQLPKPAPGTELDPTITDLADAINAHADVLNARIFTHRDYAVIARK